MDELWFAQNCGQWITLESLIQNQSYSELEEAWFAEGEKVSQEILVEIMFDAFFAGVPLSN